MSEKKGQFNMWTISSTEFKAHVARICLSKEARQMLSKVQKDQYSIKKDQKEKIDRFISRLGSPVFTGKV